MSAATVNLTIEQGATFLRTLIFKDSDGNLQDLTGQTFRGQIRPFAGSPNLIASFVCTILDQITNKGQMQIFLSSATTSGLPIAPQDGSPIAMPNYLAYDLERIFVDNTVQRVIGGQAIISPEVTT
jgi:hypothetical protein